MFCKINNFISLLLYLSCFLVRELCIGQDLGLPLRLYVTHLQTSEAFNNVILNTRVKPIVLAKK